MLHLPCPRYSTFGALILAAVLIAGDSPGASAQDPPAPPPGKTAREKTAPAKAVRSKAVPAQPATPKAAGPKRATAPRPTEPAGPSTPLEGTAWKVTHVGKDPVTGPATTRSPSLLFDAAEQRVSGSTGCNRLSGRYKVDGTRLSFPPFATTRMVCPDVIDLESRVLTALQKVARYRIVGQQLDLLDAKGVVLLKLGL